MSAYIGARRHVRRTGDARRSRCRAAACRSSRPARVLRTNIGCSSPQRDAPIVRVRLSRRTSVLSPTVAYSPVARIAVPLPALRRRAEQGASLVEQPRHDRRAFDAKTAGDRRVGRERDRTRGPALDLLHVHRPAHAARALRAREQVVPLERAVHVQRIEPSAHDEPRERRTEQRIGHRTRRAVGIGGDRSADVPSQATERIHRHRDDERIVRRRPRETEPAARGQRARLPREAERVHLHDARVEPRPRDTARRSAHRPPPTGRAARRASR